MEGTHEVAFAALCQRAFRGGDAVAAAVLLGVERNDFAVGLSSNPLPDAHVGPFKIALIEVGIPEGTQHLAEEHVARMRAVKNQQRELFHVHNTARQHQVVAELLRDCAFSQPRAPTDLSTDPHSTLQATTRFVSAHQGNIGAHSFIHGLRVTLERQLETPASCIIWRVPETTLSQSGGEVFAHDAVKLLTALHFFVLEIVPQQTATTTEPSPQIATSAREGHDEDGWIDWQAHPQWNDRSIVAVLRGLPETTDLEARPAGTQRFADAGVEPMWSRCSAEDIPEAWCSHCQSRQTHSMVEESGTKWRRSIFKCRGCGGRTLPCRGDDCQAMTKGGVWDDNKCAVCAGDLHGWPG